MLEFALPFRVRSKGMAELRLALGLDREHLAGVIEDGSGGRLFRARPLRIGQGTERRRFFADTDVARDEVSLFERNVEAGVIRELKGERFPLSARIPFWRAELQRRRARGSSPLHSRQLDQSEKSSDAMFEVDDEVAFVQPAETE